MKGDNAFALIAAWQRSARKAGLPKDYIEATIKEATSGDYEHLCKTLGV